MSAATSLYDMFHEATAYQGTGISSWDVSNAVTMAFAFDRARSFAEDISQWDVSKVTDIRQVLYGASSFSSDLCRWGAKLPTTASVGLAFASSGCPSSGDPDLSASPSGPFCHTCNAPTSAPTKSPTKAPTPVPKAAPTLAVFNTRAELDTAISAGDWTTSQYGPVAQWATGRITDFYSKSLLANPFKELVCTVALPQKSLTFVLQLCSATTQGSIKMYPDGTHQLSLP